MPRNQEIFARVTKGYTETKGSVIPTRLIGLHQTWYQWREDLHAIDKYLQDVFDHNSLWIKNGKPEMFITQPYHFVKRGSTVVRGDYEAPMLAALTALTAYCKKYRLTFAIKPEDSWWMPGSTTAIIIVRA